MTIKLMRDCRPETNTVFWAAPFGTKKLANGEPFDFDAFFAEVIVPTCGAAGMRVLRADQVYGKGDVAETAWHGIQLAPVVLVDFSARSCNVAAEFALVAGAREADHRARPGPEDIPSDVQRALPLHPVRERLAVDPAAARRARQGAARHAWSSRRRR